GKVKLTKEQANAIERHNRNNSSGNDGILNNHARNYGNFESKSWGDPYTSLNKLEISKLAKALYIGYEIEPEFKDGDWVYSLSDNKVYKISSIYDSKAVLDDEDYSIYLESRSAYSNYTN